MVNSFRVLLERIMLVAVCFIIPSMMLLLYLSGQKQDVAKRVSEEYLESVAESGVIDREEYEWFLTELARVSGCTAELSCDLYGTEPYYGYYEMGDIGEFYKKRNVRTNYPVSSELPDVVVEDIDRLFLQTKSNASVFASLIGDLDAMTPVDGVADSCTVIVPDQEVYVGEQLVTVLLQSKGGVSFCRLADSMVAPNSGEYTLPLSVNGVPIGESIHVKAWSKTAVCERGHVYPATKEVIEQYKVTGKWEKCPYCHMYVDDLALSVSSCEVPLGTAVESVPVTVQVTYMDGEVKVLSLTDVSHNYDPNYSGEQLIGVSVGGVTKEVGTILTSAPTCSVCGVAVSERYYSDYEKEQRCVTCLQSVPLYLGESFQVKSTIGHEQIVDALLNEGEYRLGRGNYLSMAIYKEGERRSSMEGDTFFRSGRIVQKTGGRE